MAQYELNIEGRCGVKEGASADAWKFICNQSGEPTG